MINVFFFTGQIIFYYIEFKFNGQFSINLLAKFLYSGYYRTISFEKFAAAFCLWFSLPDNNKALVPGYPCIGLFCPLVSKGPARGMEGSQGIVTVLLQYGGGICLTVTRKCSYLHAVSSAIISYYQGLLHHRTCKRDFLCSWPSLNSYLK